MTYSHDIFKIIPSKMDGSWLFHTLNNLVFGGLLSREDLRNELCDFMIRKIQLYDDLWEGDFDTLIQKMIRNIFGN